MQEVNKRLNFSGVLMLIIITSLTFMVIPAWIPFLRKGWVLLIIATIIILLNWRKYIPIQAVVALLLYEIVVFSNALSGDAYFETWTSAIFEFLILFVPSSLAVYCINSSNKKFVRSLVYIVFIGFIIELVASYIVMGREPGIVRALYLRSKEEGGLDFQYSFFRMGILDYGMGHAIPLLIAPLFLWFKDGTRKGRIISVALILLCIILTWFSESATAVLLMVLMVIMGLLVNKKRSLKSNVIIVIVASLLAAVLMSSSVMLIVFDFLTNLLGADSILGSRLEELKISIQDDQLTGDLEARVDLYGMSIDYLSGGNLILGSSQMPGQHSGFLDRFSTLGLVGFIPLVLFFYFSLKTIWNSLIENHKIYYLECIVGALLLLSFKGIWVWPIFLLLYVVSPCMLIMKQDKR